MVKLPDVQQSNIYSTSSAKDACTKRNPRINYFKQFIGEMQASAIHGCDTDEPVETCSILEVVASRSAVHIALGVGHCIATTCQEGVFRKDCFFSGVVSRRGFTGTTVAHGTLSGRAGIQYMNSKPELSAKS